jgi:YVTN family beta-propeller protein
VVDTATNTVISTRAVGYADGDVAIAPDGRLYISGYNGYAVVDTATMTVVDTMDLWPDNHYALALNADGSRAYAVAVNIDDGGSYSSLVVIDTATNTPIATVYDPRGDFQPYETVWHDVALSPDGSRAYVTLSDGKTITVIDTATNTIIDTFITDQDEAGHFGYTQYITVGPDGTLYITDGAEGTVYAVTVGDDPLML